MDLGTNSKNPSCLTLWKWGKSFLKMEYSSILLWKQHIILFWFLLCFCCCGMKNVNYFFLLFSDTLDTAAPIPQPLKIIGHNIDNLWSHINFHIIFIWCLLISNYKYSINPFLSPLFCMEEIRILIINLFNYHLRLL